MDMHLIKTQFCAVKHKHNVFHAPTDGFWHRLLRSNAEKSSVRDARKRRKVAASHTPKCFRLWLGRNLWWKQEHEPLLAEGRV